MARFQLIRLDPLPGGAARTQAFALDEGGRACGEAGLAGNGTHAVRWEPTGMPRDLDGDPSRWSRAIACNATGVVVGEHGLENPMGRRAFVWTEARGFRTLPPLPGDSQAWANAVAADGRVAGASTGLGHRVTPVVWDTNGVPRALSVVAGRDAEVFAFRGAVIAGGTRTDDAPAHEDAFVGPVGGPYRRLGSVEPGTHSRALGVNAAGTVVGYAEDEYRSQHAVAWGPGGVRKLGFRADGGADQASAVNEHGQIVGFAYHPDAHRLLAFLHEGGVTRDLNTLVDLVATGWRLEEATAISAQGFVVGNGSLYGNPRGFLLR